MTLDQNYRGNSLVVVKCTLNATVRSIPYYFTLGKNIFTAKYSILAHATGASAMNFQMSVFKSENKYEPIESGNTLAYT